MAETIELDDEVKRFIVTSLACFDKPSKVAAAVKEEYALEISRQRVHAYDPTKKAGADLSEGLKALFDTTRKAFLSETAEIPVASRAFRLRKLQHGIEAMEKVGNHAMVAQLCEQAAKEVGGVFSNEHKLNHSGRLDFGVPALLQALDGKTRGLPGGG